MCNNKGKFKANVYPYFHTFCTHKPLHNFLHKVGPKVLLYDSINKRGKLSLFLPHLNIDIQVHMERGHDISKRQRNLSKNNNLAAISKKG